MYTTVNSFFAEYLLSSKADRHLSLQFQRKIDANGFESNPLVSLFQRFISMSLHTYRNKDAVL